MREGQRRNPIVSEETGADYSSCAPATSLSICPLAQLPPKQQLPAVLIYLVCTGPRVEKTVSKNIEHLTTELLLFTNLKHASNRKFHKKVQNNTKKGVFCIHHCTLVEIEIISGKIHDFLQFFVKKIIQRAYKGVKRW